MEFSVRNHREFYKMKYRGIPELYQLTDNILQLIAIIHEARINAKDNVNSAMRKHIMIKNKNLFEMQHVKTELCVKQAIYNNDFDICACKN